MLNPFKYFPIFNYYLNHQISIRANFDNVLSSLILLNIFMTLTTLVKRNDKLTLFLMKIKLILFISLKKILNLHMNTC